MHMLKDSMWWENLKKNDFWWTKQVLNSKALLLPHPAFDVRILALFSSPWKPKSFQDSPSHRILWHMHETLNIDENKN